MWDIDSFLDRKVGPAAGVWAGERRDVEGGLRYEVRRAVLPGFS